MTPDEEIWTLHQVSEFLAIPESTLRKWRSRGEGPPPFHAGGRHWRWRRSTVLAWTEAREAREPYHRPIASGGRTPARRTARSVTEQGQGQRTARTARRKPA